MSGRLWSVVGAFHVGWWDVAAVLVEASVDDPVDPFGGGELELVDGAPRASGFDHLGLVEPVDCLGERVSYDNPTTPTGPSRPRSAPAPTGRLTAGDYHSCASHLDHTLWCWGYNGQGQLGLGDNEDRTIPTQVGTDTDWTEVAAGDYHTCATRIEHTLWCWGYNPYGQLGQGDTQNRNIPTQVGTGTRWAPADAGWSHTCATRTDHTRGAGGATMLASWGSAT